MDVGVPPEIATPLASRDGRAEVVVVVLVEGVERLRVRITHEVIQVLRLPKARVLRTRGRVMVRGKRWWEVGWLEV